MEKIWLKSYPPGVPAEIDPSQLRTLKELIETSCQRYPDRVAFIQMDATLTYRELDEYSSAFAAWLQQTGLKKGDRMAIMLPNTLQYPIAMFGALRAGIVVVNTNPLYTAPELEHQLVDSGAMAILVLENFAHVLQSVLPRTQIKHVLVTAVGDWLPFPKSHHRQLRGAPCAQAGPAVEHPGCHRLQVSRGIRPTRSASQPVDVGPEDLAFLQYTGGTTGVAKGAMLSHGNISANVLQAEAFLGKDMFQTARDLAYGNPAVPHLRALRKLHGRMPARVDQPAHHQSARHAVPDRGPEEAPCNYISGVNTLVQRHDARPGLQRTGLQCAAGHARRWHGGTGRRCRALEAGYGLRADAGMGTDGDLARRLHQSRWEMDFNGSIGLPISIHRGCDQG